MKLIIGIDNGRLTRPVKTSLSLIDISSSYRCTQVFPTAQQAPGPAAITTLAEAEKDLIQGPGPTGGHRGKSCELLGISRPTLERKLRKYGLKASIDADTPPRV